MIDTKNIQIGVYQSPPSSHHNILGLTLLWGYDDPKSKQMLKIEIPSNKNHGINIKYDTIPENL